MQLTKRESKYRLKIINERHYNKNMQLCIDMKIGASYPTYYDLYNNIRKEEFSLFNSMYTDIHFKELNKSMKNIGVSIRDSGMTFRNLCDILKDLSSAWNENINI